MPDPESILLLSDGRVAINAQGQEVFKRCGPQQCLPSACCEWGPIGRCITDPPRLRIKMAGSFRHYDPAFDPGTYWNWNAGFSAERIVDLTFDPDPCVGAAGGPFGAYQIIAGEAPERYLTIELGVIRVWLKHNQTSNCTGLPHPNLGYWCASTHPTGQPLTQIIEVQATFRNWLYGNPWPFGTQGILSTAFANFYPTLPGRHLRWSASNLYNTALSSSFATSDPCRGVPMRYNSPFTGSARPHFGEPGIEADITASEFSAELIEGFCGCPTGGESPGGEQGATGAEALKYSNEAQWGGAGCCG